MIKISGIIEQSMGKFFCLRGFAPIKDLAELSVESKSFQRNLITKHEGEMKKFLEDRTATFFPEVILSVNLANTEHPYDEDDEMINEEILGDFIEKSDYDQYTTEIDQISDAISYRTELKKCQLGALTIDINYAKSTFNINSVTNKSKVLVGSITIDEKKLINKFIRIDGNHRLSAAKDLADEFNYQIPFCLVLFVSSDYQDKFSTLFFHNINFKQIPITKEHNLKIIISSIPELYSDDQLRDKFGLNFLFTRYVLSENELEGIDLSYYAEVKKLINGNEYTYFVEVFELIFDIKPDIKDWNSEQIVEFIKVELQSINAALRECKTEAKNNIAVLGALTVYLLQDKNKYEAFLKWIMKNDISSIAELKISNVIDIYDKIYNNLPKKVFLSRWYPEDTDSESNKAKKRLEVISKIVKEDFQLELIDIGNKEGGTFDVRQALYMQLSDSDIFIADLTGARHNVMVEVGYAIKNVGLGRMIFYFQQTSDCPKPPFNLDGFRNEFIEDSADLKDKIPNHIHAILEEIQTGQI